MPYICGRNNKCNRMTEKYINPHTDFGFKRLFGSEFNKELLISFLNAMFHGEQNVQDVTYLNSEQLGDRTDARRAIFDVYCENDKGEKFIVEMYIRSFLKTAPFIILRFLFVNRHNEAVIGIFISIQYIQSAC